MDRPYSVDGARYARRPFVERGVTRLEMPVDKSVTYPEDFGAAQR